MNLPDKTNSLGVFSLGSSKSKFSGNITYLGFCKISNWEKCRCKLFLTDLT